MSEPTADQIYTNMLEESVAAYRTENLHLRELLGDARHDQDVVRVTLAQYHRELARQYDELFQQIERLIVHMKPEMAAPYRACEPLTRMRMLLQRTPNERGQALIAVLDAVGDLERIEREGEARVNDPNAPRYSWRAAQEDLDIQIGEAKERVLTLYRGAIQP